MEMNYNQDSMEQQSVPHSHEEEISCGEDEELVEVCAECEQDPCVCDDEVAELAEEADDKVDALINLLIKKGVFTEAEFEKEFENMFEEVASEEEIPDEEENDVPEVPEAMGSSGMRTF